jgi:hypothetical protein
LVLSLVLHASIDDEEDIRRAIKNLRVENVHCHFGASSLDGMERQDNKMEKIWTNPIFMTSVLVSTQKTKLSVCLDRFDILYRFRAKKGFDRCRALIPSPSPFVQKTQISTGH